MTDTAPLIAAKEKVTADLAALDLKPLHLKRVDPRLLQYVQEVQAAPARHNLFEQLAVLRFCHMAARHGLRPAPVRAFIHFYETLRFPGLSGLTTYKLTPVQVFQYTALFGFWKDGRRLCREMVLFVPRKFSKTTSTAALAVWDLVFGEANSETYIGAMSQDQAKKCFDVIRNAVRYLDPRGVHFTVNEQIIKSRRRGRTALAQCLTANARTKDGLNASTVIMDEFAQARDNTLLSVLTTSMGVRRNPLTVIITTASDQVDGPFAARLDGYKQMLLGQRPDDPTVFAHIFQPDPGDPDDSPATWQKVQPHLGITVHPDFYTREWQSAQRNGTEAMLAFRTKLLNVFDVARRRAWITADALKPALKHFTPADIPGNPRAVVAIDLSESDDFSAVTLAARPAGSPYFYFHTAYFFPEDALPGHPNETLYRRWAKEAHLTILPGNKIDYNHIVNYVLSLSQYARIQKIGYDPYKSADVVNMLAARGGGMQYLEGIRQHYGNFTSPTDSFEHGLKDGKILINDNPINSWCFANAVLDSDRMENHKPIKLQHNRKIDGVITMLMCQRLIIDLTARSLPGSGKKPLS